MENIKNVFNCAKEYFTSNRKIIIKIFAWAIPLAVIIWLRVCYQKPTIPDINLKLKDEDISEINEVYSRSPINPDEWKEKRIIFKAYLPDDKEKFRVINKREKIIIENKRNISAERIDLSIELSPENFKFASIAFDNQHWGNISDETQIETKSFERAPQNKIRLNIKEVSKEKRVILIWFVVKYKEELNKFQIKVEAEYYSQGSHIGDGKKEDDIYINK